MESEREPPEQVNNGNTDVITTRIHSSEEADLPKDPKSEIRNNLVDEIILESRCEDVDQHERA